MDAEAVPRMAPRECAQAKGFPFGRGWWMERSSVRMVEPRPLALTAVPISWTPSTNGVITAPIVFAPMTTRADFTQWKGKLAGRIVLVSGTEDVRTPPAASGISAEEFARLAKYEPPKFSSGNSLYLEKSYFFPRAMEDFLKAEGALAYARITKRDGKIVMGDGYRFAPGGRGAAARRRDRGGGLSPARPPWRGRAGADARDRERCPFRRQRSAGL